MEDRRQLCASALGSEDSGRVREERDFWGKDFESSRVFVASRGRRIWIPCLEFCENGFERIRSNLGFHLSVGHPMVPRAQNGEILNRVRSAFAVRLNMVEMKPTRLLASCSIGIGFRALSVRADQKFIFQSAWDRDSARSRFTYDT